MRILRAAFGPDRAVVAVPRSINESDENLETLATAADFEDDERNGRMPRGP